MPRTVLYLVTSACGAEAPGIQHAIGSAGSGGKVVVTYVHDPKANEQLKDSLSAGAFVGLEQVDSVAKAAWASEEACGQGAMDEARRAAAAAGVDAVLEVLSGPVLDVVRASAERHSVDEIVVCRTPGSLLARFFEPRGIRTLRRQLDVPVTEVLPSG